MQKNTLFIFLVLLVSLTISACTDMKKHFPDKEKDYQLTTEIPHLKVPSDLSEHAIQKPVEEKVLVDNRVKVPAPALENSQTPKLENDSEVKDGEKDSIENENENDKTAEIDDSSETSESDEENEAEADEEDEEEVEEPEKPVYIELVKFSGGATRIRVEESFGRIWRLVGKAISRNSIEILERNQADRTYAIKYDADFEKVEDGSLWDEVVFIFGADPAKEKTYKIKVVENGALIEIIILDDKDKPLSKDAGLVLLKLLYQSIKQDLNGDII